MPLHLVQRLWTSLLAVCIPSALAVLAWVLFDGGRPVAAELAGTYLLIVVAGRAQAADKARRAKPARLERVRTQIERVKSTLPEDEAEPAAEFVHAVSSAVNAGRLGVTARAPMAASHPAVSR